ncbi:MAG: hypothetical protein ACOYMV_13300 [Verrucomicrobiia bacterium]
MKLALATVLSALLVFGIASVSMGQSTGAVTRSKLYRSDPSVNSVRGRDPFAPRPNNAGRGNDAATASNPGLTFSTNQSLSLRARAVTSSVISVSLNVPVTLSSVNVSFRHYDPANLSLQLVKQASNGTTQASIKLWTGFADGPFSEIFTFDPASFVGVTQPGLNDITFSDSASIPIGGAYVTNNAPRVSTNIVGATTSVVYDTSFVGSFIPETPLGSLSNMMSAGNWVLILDNTISADSSSALVSWGLTMTIQATGSGVTVNGTNVTFFLPRSLADTFGIGTTNAPRSQTER